MTRALSLILMLVLPVLVGCVSPGIHLHAPSVGQGDEHVIVLHGLARTSRAMRPTRDYLLAEGYTVVNVGYPSRHHPIEELAADWLPPAVARCRANGATRIHFVGHSLGGILIRYYLSRHELPELGRVVMYSPPNQGTEVADKLDWFWPQHWLNGPVARQLGTGPASVPLQLGAVDYPVGVLTGSRSINLILSLTIPGPDDGKISLERAKLAGMADYKVLAVSHPYIMAHDQALWETVHFLRHGHFQ